MPCRLSRRADPGGAEDSGLYGQFYIESDTHTFTNGKAQMDLTLAFENLMDEEEIEKDTNNKKNK